MNLRTLVLVKCKILGRQLDAFWTLCSRLESLELDEVDMDLSLPPTSTKTRSQRDRPSSARLPQLQELTIRRMRRAHPLRQLELLIRPCPKLRTLCWSIDWFRPFPSNQFCNLFVSLTWPDLDSIHVSGHGSRIYEHDQTRLLGAAKQPFRLLDLGAQAEVPRPKCGT
ncbi:hypothetical protein BGZ67_008530 [Mortierella alpina]|nr:hypothetical protein BGZ67_008530 [Mortierella alpina]